MNWLRRTRAISASTPLPAPDHVPPVYRYVDPGLLPRIDQNQLLEASCPSVAFDGAETVREFERTAPEFIDDPDGVGLFQGLGVGRYVSPPAFVAAIPNARLVGYRTCLFDERFTHDEAPTSETGLKSTLGTLGQPDGFLNEETHLRPTGVDHEFRFEDAGRSRRHLAGPHIVLCSHEPANYGSFLFRVAPKLTLIDDEAIRSLPVVVYAKAENAKRLLELLGVSRDRIIQHDLHAITQIDQAICPGLRNPHAFLDPESHAMFRDLAERLSEGRSGRRIYVSRQGHAKAGGSTRVMLNEAELIGRLVALGVEIVEPETMTMDEQIQTFASADLVIGPSGSGMFNVVFCRPGTMVIDIESEDGSIYAHAGLFSSCRLRYGLVVGKPDPTDKSPVHRRWTVDIDTLVRRVDGYCLDIQCVSTAPGSDWRLLD